MSFRDLMNDTYAFEDFNKKINDNDDALKLYFEKSSHKDFVFSIMHLGVLFDSISIYIGFIKEQLDKAILISDEQSKNRKMNKLIKDLNKRINAEYDFAEKTSVIDEVVLYDGELYFFVDKMKFVKLMQIEDKV